jgi:glutathione S-transferase
VIVLYLGPALRWLALYPAGETGWFDLARWPRLQAMAQALETRESAQAGARAEGLGHRPFSAPVPADPPEGAAL